MDKNKANKKGHTKLTAALFLVASIFDVLLLLFWVILICFSENDKEKLSIAGSFILVSVLFFAISVTGFHRTVHEKKKVIGNAFLMKATIFFFGIALTFIPFPDGIYATITFAVLGVLFAIITITAVKYKKRSSDHSSAAASTPMQFHFRADWEWEPAAKEYARLHQIEDLGQLTDAQITKIYNYAVGPFSYFFYWLALNGKMSEDFCKRFPTPDFVDQMRTHALTPVEALNQIDAFIDSDDLLPEIRTFIRFYYDARYIHLTENMYLYDYYDVIGNPSDRYYCVDFSWNYAEQLRLRIDAAYERWAVERAAFYDGYEEYGLPVICKPSSSHYGRELEVYPTGEKRSGFPGGPEAYAERCVQCLDNLDAAQWQRLERLVREAYDYPGMGPEHPLEQFYPLYLYISEPKNEADLVFYVSGDAEFEGDDGFSFTVRNGLIVNCGVSYDFEDAYSASSERNYQQGLDNIDYAKIRTAADAAPLVAAGKLVEVPLLPGLPGCSTSERRETVYVTPAAAEIKKLAERHLKCVLAFLKDNEPKTHFSLVYGTFEVGTPVPLLHKRIIIRGDAAKTPYKYGCKIPIWD